MYQQQQVLCRQTRTFDPVYYSRLSTVVMNAHTVLVYLMFLLKGCVSNFMFFFLCINEFFHFYVLCVFCIFIAGFFFFFAVADTNVKYKKEIKIRSNGLAQ